MIITYWIMIKTPLSFPIPITSYTFTKIQENTDQHWCFQRYFLIKEYHDRPPLAPPFIILWQLYAMMRIMLRWCGLPYSPESNSNFGVYTWYVYESRIVKISLYLFISKLENSYFHKTLHHKFYIDILYPNLDHFFLHIH